MMLSPVYFVAAFGFAGAAFFAALALAGNRGEGSGAALARLADGGALRVPAAGSGGPASGALRRQHRLEVRLAGVPFLASWRDDLQRAGLPWLLHDFVGVVAVAGMAAALIAAMVTGSFLVGLPIGLLGAALPVLFVKRRVAQRAAALNAEVVEMIDLVASSLRAGFGFMQSLELAAREQPEPLSGEIARTVREVNLGVGIDEALERLVDRTGDVDLGLVVMAVLIQRRVGGNLGEVLINIAQTIRNRVRVRGEIRTLTAQARMSVWIVGSLPVVLAAAMVAINYEYMSVLWTTQMGRLLVGVAAALELIGFYMVQRIAAIDY